MCPPRSCPLIAAVTAIAFALPSFAAVSSRGAAVAPNTTDEVRRLLTLLGAVGDDYREAFDEAGALQRPLELAAARSFLAEARVRWDPLSGADTTGVVAPALVELAAAIDHTAPVESVRERVARARAQISAVTGVSEDVYPSERPSAERGAAIYQQSCAGCHGADGNGQGPDASRLQPKPANFTDPAFMRGETPVDFFHVLTVGKPGSAMPAWGDALTPQERWNVVSHLWRLAHDNRQLAEGQGIYLSHCASCHGADGAGTGVYAAHLLTPVSDLTELPRLARRTEADLFTLVRDGIPGTAMPAFRALTDDERWKVVAFLRWLSLDGPPGRARAEGLSGAPDRVAVPQTSLPTSHAAPTAEALPEIRRLLDASLSAYQSDGSQALSLLSDAYFRFEPLEPPLGVAAPDLARRVEEEFLQLRGIMLKAVATPEAARAAAAITADLDAVGAALAPHANAYTVFMQAATIILREGFEVVLIISALLASVVKSGNRQMQRSILIGTAAGFGVSLATAYVLRRMLQGASAAASVPLEGLTMLLAALVLFWVSYWLISRAEAEKWQRFIQGQVQSALSAGSALALAGVAFLAVYREGVETVLFYEALLGSASGGAGTVVGGLVAGGAALVVVAVMFLRFGRRIPMRPFFLGTGGLLYYLAIVFAGQGVAELQVAGWIGLTPVPGVPRISVLGLYPTLETLAAQALLVGLLIYAVLLTAWRRWSSGTPAQSNRSQQSRSLSQRLAMLAAVLGLVAATGTVSLGQEGVFLTEEQAPAAVFADADTFVRQVINADPDVRGRMRIMLGAAEPSIWEDQYVGFKALRGDQVLGYAIIVEEIGKHRPITFVVGVRPDGRVNDVAVMAYREAYGGEVRSKRFLNQYRNKSAADGLRAPTNITNIAGATLSVDAASRAVQKALAVARIAFGAGEHS
jgi:high-affinity iron transporter